MLKIKQRGDFSKTKRFFNKMLGRQYLNSLEKYGQAGVDALRSATPVDSGVTADSWTFEIERTETKTSLSWLNTNRNDGVNIAIILQYGHGTGTGGYVQGLDYINPAIKPIFDQIGDAVWKEVTNA